MRHSNSLVVRAVLALVLMIGFYLLALAITAGLFYIPYAEVVYAHRLSPKLALICVLGGVAILWSVLPRFDKFVAPGPRLTPECHPRLFKDVEHTAKAVGQAMSSEVYLVPDVNAWVAQRGGVMGFGSRRVMGLGLPLMRVLTCFQFRAVLAHEFGHYHGGDTKLGPWVYKTRSAIGRTLGALGGADGKGSLLQLPFLWYGKMFLRVTHAVSRRQEFVADELAARTVGAKPLADGLRVVHGAAPAFQFYMSRECAPVLNAGFRPPLVDGFQQFMQADQISRLVAKQTEEELSSGKTDPYDTHPPLRERLAAVQHLPAGQIPQPDDPATSPFDRVDELEFQMLAAMAGPEAAGKLKAVDWSKVCDLVYVPEWRQLVERNAPALAGITPETLPQVAADPKLLRDKVVDGSGEKPDRENAEGLAGGLVGAAVALLLLAKGGHAQTAPGTGVLIKLDSIEFEPFALLSSLKTGALTPETWSEKCAALGIAGQDLGRVLPAKA